ncbi:DgyrCDS294 [Dimorphilus gyrociliatus]|uniref:DgyrCDS294 n=1 Tax=Dimorphilus gyrociliatus TaxID=2664684 RepID=A0A7I8V6Q0_9ANNE|nr:DgyrCDS294 [Dimorphilus gyrociliatus]
MDDFTVDLDQLLDDMESEVVRAPTAPLKPAYPNRPQPPPYSFIAAALNNQPEILRATPDEDRVIGPLYSEFVTSEMPPDIVPPSAASFSESKKHIEEESDEKDNNTQINDETNDSNFTNFNEQTQTNKREVTSNQFDDFQCPDFNSIQPNLLKVEETETFDKPSIVMDSEEKVIEKDQNDEASPINLDLDILAPDEIQMEKPKRPSILPVQKIDALISLTTNEEVGAEANIQETKSNASVDSVERFLSFSSCGPIEPPKTPAVEGDKRLPAIRPSSLEISSQIPAEDVTSVPNEEVSTIAHTDNTSELETVEEPVIESENIEGAQAQIDIPSSTLTEIPLTELGIIAPEWVKDADAPNCKQCEIKFTFTKRRHHCRACGNVFCAACCSFRAKLPLNNNRDCRVCSVCMQDMNRAQAFLTPTPTTPNSIIRKDTSQRSNPKSVMFSDGIKPGGALTDLDATPPPRPHARSSNGPRKLFGSKSNSSMRIPPIGRCQSLIKENCLPPVVGVDLNEEEISRMYSEKGEEGLQFLLNSNLIVQVDLVDLDCCLRKKCWIFSTDGMLSAAQPEVLLIIQMIDNEQLPPKDIFEFLEHLYEKSLTGEHIEELQVVPTHNSSSFLDSRSHAGFLFVKPTLQCLCKLKEPRHPYLAAILVERPEIVWAKLLPLRLLFRLGAEFRYYPFPLVNIRDRPPVFGEVGNSIVRLLADVRNLQYTLVTISGAKLHLREHVTELILPFSSYNQVMKVLRDCEEHVVAMATSFSNEADSHLVCMQCLEGVDLGTYSTQAINIEKRARRLTAATFVVFNGSLKTQGPAKARSVIVEDGVMIQLTADAIKELKSSLVATRPFKASCAEQDQVLVTWSHEQDEGNSKIESEVDGKALDGVKSLQIKKLEDLVSSSGKFAIRWTNVYVFKSDDAGTPIGKTCEYSELPKLAEALAHCSALALMKFSEMLVDEKIKRIGVRVNISSENVGFQVGGNGSLIKNDSILSSLDEHLVQIMYNAASVVSESIEMEFVLYIVE